MNSITRRWIRGSLAFTFVVLVLAEIAIALFTVNRYYDGARGASLRRLSAAVAATGRRAGFEELLEEDRQDLLRQYVARFDEKDKFELMLLDGKGAVVATSSGFLPGAGATAPDFVKALAAAGTGEYVGRGTGRERVLAMTTLLPEPAGDIAAIRIVTSLAKVDERIVSLIALALIGGALVLLFSLLSGGYFIRSIVNPMGKIEAGAARIAAGDFGVRIEGEYTSEINRLCETINNMAEELGKNEKLKNEFISSVSHELRTPLTAIGGWAETLAQNPSLDAATRQKGMAIIRRETERLHGMVEELLDFSRLQEGRPLQLATLDLGAEAEGAVLVFEKRAQGEGISLLYQEPSELLPVRADRDRLRQVFVNLIDNALKYSGEGDKVEVQVGVLPAKENPAAGTPADNVPLPVAFFQVQDQGPGIAPEEAELVKKKFYKGRGARKGSGIGLALVDEIVRSHGGTLQLLPAPEKGTLARVELPLAPRTQAPATVIPNETEKETIQTNG